MSCSPLSSSDLCPVMRDLTRDKMACGKIGHLE